MFHASVISAADGKCARDPASDDGFVPPKCLAHWRAASGMFNRSDGCCKREEITIYTPLAEHITFHGEAT